MELLLENDLIFGSLLPVDEPHLVARYNKALKSFGLPATKLQSFEIDMTGYSPQIAQELGDRLYLDPAGVNRRFIILTPAQIDLPVVHTLFSNTEELMVDFFQSNAKALYALTIKDVVYGEIEDSVFKVEDIEDLLSIEQVEFKISTSSNLLAQAHRLNLMIERLRKEPEAWNDDAMLHEMVKIAKVTGDVRTNSLLPETVIFRHNTYWTAHFGGVYIFNDDKSTTVIGHKNAPGFRKSRPWQVSYLDLEDHDRVFHFLAETGRIELPRGAWIERSGLLELRSKMAAQWLAKELEPELDFNNTDWRWIKGWVARNMDLVQAEGSIPLIEWVTAQVSNWSGIDMEDIKPKHRFVLCRANPEHTDRFLVNRLISHYLPFDYITGYAYNKPAFYAEYEKWPDSYKRYVVEELARTYMKDRAAFRKKVYG